VRNAGAHHADDMEIGDVASIDFVQRTIAGVAIVTGGHDPLTIGYRRDKMDIWERARNVGRHPLRLSFEVADAEKQDTGGCEDLCLCH
jgi:hypothetical protein